MKPVRLILLLLSSNLLLSIKTLSQDSTGKCKVLMASINTIYNGDCKKGFANGEGDAKGIHHYTGTFKNGLPNGKGTYYFDDTHFFVGNFQDGLKEGKGEMHYTNKDKPDSIIKGYWSGDEYRGKTYTTYSTDAVGKFAYLEISPSTQSGDRISIEISNTSFDPIVLTELISLDNNSPIKFMSTYKSPQKVHWTFQILKFPAKLRGQLSNGQNFTLELYKNANWQLRIFINE